MRENKFEKNVQQRMDEFRLRPSDDVWGKVAGELHRKKKRRAVFFILLLAGFSMLGYSGFYFLNHSKQNIVEGNSTLNTKKSSPSGKELLMTPAKNKAGDEAKDQTVSDKQAGKLPADEENAENILSKEQVPAGRGIETDRIKIPVEKIEKLKSKTTVVSTNIPRQNKIARPTGRSTGSKSINDKVSTVKANRDRDNDILAGKEVEARTDIVDKNEEANAFVDLPVVKNPDDTLVVNAVALKVVVDSSSLSAEKPTAATPRSSKIKWGIDFSVGVSDSRKSALPFSNGQKALDSYNSVPQAGFPGSAGYFPVQPPSPVDPGLGFKVGPVAQMQLSRRSRVSFGLQYAFMTNRMKTGTYTATSVVVNNSISQSLRLSAVYQGVYHEDFTNRFHFIQAPVTYHLQLNKGKHLPIDWNVGASAGYLVATNGLLYDSAAGGIYYHDKDAYNKFQFNVHTGFSFRFGSSRRIQWSVGPELSMAMNKLIDDPYSKKQYLMYGGVTGRLIFSKKNK